MKSQQRLLKHQHQNLLRKHQLLQHPLHLLEVTDRPLTGQQTTTVKVTYLPSNTSKHQGLLHQQSPSTLLLLRQQPKTAPLKVLKTTVLPLNAMDAGVIAEDEDTEVEEASIVVSIGAAIGEDVVEASEGVNVVVSEEASVKDVVDGVAKEENAVGSVVVREASVVGSVEVKEVSVVGSVGVREVNAADTVAVSVANVVDIVAEAVNGVGIASVDVAEVAG